MEGKSVRRPGRVGGELWESGAGERGERARGWGWEPVWRASHLPQAPNKGLPQRVALGITPVYPRATDPWGSQHPWRCLWVWFAEGATQLTSHSYFTNWWNRCNRLIICNVKLITSLNLSAQEKLNLIYNVLEAQSSSYKLWPWGEGKSLGCKSFLWVFWDTGFHSILALPLAGWVNLVKLFNLSEPLSSSVKWEWLPYGIVHPLSH